MTATTQLAHSELNLSRQQRYLLAAAQNVQRLKAAEPPAAEPQPANRSAAWKSWREEADIYGGLCHKLPILILTNGLCQTLAFVESKANGDSARARAYRTLRSHIAATLSKPEVGLLPYVQRATVGEYIRATRNLIAAWAYYKRFAESILNVDPTTAKDTNQ